MEFLKAEYTEVWVPSTVVPLVQFADKVTSIAASGIDTFGLAEVPATSVVERLLEFDEVVSWYGGNRVEFQTAMRAAGVRSVFHAALPAAEGAVHAVDFFAQQVGAPAGLSPWFNIASSESRGSLVLHPFSGSTRKNWPLAKYRELAAAVNMPVEWLAGPEDKLPGAIRIDDLGNLAQWLAGASVYVGNDSGITHLAAAVGVRTVVLFGPTDPRVWCPRGAHVRHLRSEPLSALSAESVLGLIG